MYITFSRNASVSLYLERLPGLLRSSSIDGLAVPRMSAQQRRVLDPVSVQLPVT